MTFGYLGYIWAMLGCAIVSIVEGGSAIFLYAVARRARGGASETTHTFDTLPLPPRDPHGPSAALRNDLVARARRAGLLTPVLL